MPKIKHPDVKKSIEVRDDQVDLYTSQGWVVTSPPKKS